MWTQKGAAGKTYEFHSQDGKLLMEWQSGAGGFLREHIYAGPRRIAEVHTPTGQAAKVTHAHPDPAGSPALMTDASGLVASREQYRPYGGKLLSPASNDSAGFAGKPFDAVTGLSYMSARYYNPTLGRFISPDPVHFVEGNIHSFNRYAYANNNPMRYIDPTGLEGESISETDKTEKSDKSQMPVGQSKSSVSPIDSVLPSLAPVVVHHVEPTLAPITVFGTRDPKPNDNKDITIADSKHTLIDIIMCIVCLLNDRRMPPPPPPPPPIMRPQPGIPNKTGAINTPPAIALAKVEDRTQTASSKMR